MNPSHIVPDENYIQRLFPKCPPTNKFVRSSSNQELVRSQANPSKSKMEGNKRPNRSRVHRHSRRELEARHARVRSTNLNQDRIKGDTSDTNDDNTRPGFQADSNNFASYSNSLTPKTSLKRSSSHSFEQAAPDISGATLAGGQSTTTTNQRRSNRYAVPRLQTQGLDRQIGRAIDRPEPILIQPCSSKRQVDQRLDRDRQSSAVSELGARTTQTLTGNDQRYAHDRAAYHSRADINLDDLNSTSTSAAEPSLQLNLMPSDSTKALISNQLLDEEAQKVERKVDKTSLIDVPKTSGQIVGRASHLSSIGRCDTDSQVYETSDTSDILIAKNNRVDEGHGLLRSSIQNKVQENARCEITSSMKSSSLDCEAGNSAARDVAISTVYNDSATTTTADTYSNSKLDETPLKNSGSHCLPLHSKSSSNIDIVKRDCTAAHNSLTSGEDRYINVFVYNQPKQQPSRVRADETRLDEQPISPTLRNYQRRSRTIRFSDETDEVLARNSETYTSPPDSIEITEIIVGEGESGENLNTNNLRRTETKPQNVELDDSGSGKLVSVFHKDGQELLTSGANEIEDCLIRNDVSSEELFNISDSLEEQRDSSCLGLAQNPPSNAISNTSNHSNEAILQTVDEEVEQVLEVEDKSGVDLELSKKETMSGNSLFSKRAFVPPGYPQRITSTTTGGAKDDKPDNKSSLEGAKESASIGLSQETDQVVNSKLTESLENLSLKQSVLESRDEDGVEKYNSSSHLTRHIEHPPTMPSISESQHESDTENQVAGYENLKPPLNINRLPLSHPDPTYGTTFDQNQDPNSNRIVSHDDDGLQTNKFSTLDNSKLDQEPNQTNLRHHKLPNETSHYSIARSHLTSNSENLPPIISSSIQFSAMSEAESGADDSGDGIRSLVASKRNISLGRSETTSSGHNSRSNMPVSLTKFDDDVIPSAKTELTALIFPRLDEGLSSGAESCDDEVEDDDECDDERDDERAMDADVDDDEDKVGVLDEYDLENDSEPGDRVGSSINSTDQSSRSQSRSHLRFVDSQHLHGNSMMTNGNQEHQNKASVVSYGGYMAPTPIDQTDMKTSGNFTTHNGQPNFWMSSGGHTEGISSQPASSQHFTQRNPHMGLSNNFMPKVTGIGTTFPKGDGEFVED